MCHKCKWHWFKGTSCQWYEIELGVRIGDTNSFRTATLFDYFYFRKMYRFFSKMLALNFHIAKRRRRLMHIFIQIFLYFWSPHSPFHFFKCIIGLNTLYMRTQCKLNNYIYRSTYFGHFKSKYHLWTMHGMNSKREWIAFKNNGNQHIIVRWISIVVLYWSIFWRSY